MRLTPGQRLLNEQKIRTAADQLISGDIPPGGRCDIKTLAHLSGVDRAAFYGSRPYTALREDFERRLQSMRTAGEHPDPRDAQIARLTQQITAFTRRVTGLDATSRRPDQLQDRRAVPHYRPARRDHPAPPNRSR